MSRRDTLREGFFLECEDLLETMSDGLDKLNQGKGDTGCINAVFRAVHSIKGGAGAFGLDNLVDFAHAFETLLDGLRTGQVSPDPALRALLLRAGDRLGELIEAAHVGRSGGERASDIDRHRGLIAELDAAGGPGPAPDAATQTTGFQPFAVDLDTLGLEFPDGTLKGRHIRFTPRYNLYASGNDPLALLRALSELGPLETQIDLSALVPLDALDPDESYLSWNLNLTGPVTEAEILEVFEFVLDKAEIHIAPLPDAAQDSPNPPSAPPYPTSAAKEGATSPAEPPRQSIRVELSRIDRLINLVGELVISEAMLSQSLSQQQGDIGKSSDVGTALGRLRQLSGELQERIMAIRAQPIRPLFQRMARIARETAAAANRQVRLVTKGEETEIDKMVIERLVDPLTHMLRNAVDHGIEPVQSRRALGKPETGTITMSAAHSSGQVILEITDDGAGIDATAVQAKAEARGLVSPGTELSESDILQLLFEPGLSTATEVSNLSGRGVGMDVVRSEIRALGGRVTIASRRGKGTTVTIHLPLTLAVVEGMLVEVAGETLVVPSTALRETLRAEERLLHRIGTATPVLSVRGSLTPVIDLGDALGFRPPPGDLSGCPLLLVDSAAGHRIALAVDQIIHQREVVIKGLAENCGPVPGIAAATILGDGRIALIIDIDQIAEKSAAAPCALRSA